MGLTREEAIEFMWLENHKNPVVIKWQHHKTIRDLVEKLIDQIYNDHEAQLKALKAENLAETEMFNKVVKTKDERIKELECRVYHAEGYVITHAENYRICDGCFYTLTIQASMEEIVRAQDTCYSCQRYYSDKFRLKTIEEEENA